MKTIEEKNRMIAEFMGVLEYRPGGDYIERFGDPHEIEDAQYHSSWDWLMPVVHYIVADLEIVNDDVICSEEREHLMDIVPFAVIEDTYEAVVQFIEWYNENK